MTPTNCRVQIRQDDARDTRLLQHIASIESDAIRDALARLLQDNATEAGLAERVRERDGQDGVTRLFYWLTRLRQAGQLEYVLRLTDGSDVRVVPQHAGCVFRNVRFDADADYVSSRFAFVRGVDRGSQLESPLLPAVLRFESWLPAAVIALFAQPSSTRAAIGRLPVAASADVAALAELLVVTGFADTPGEPDPCAESLWDFHEVLFHSRSSAPRLGERFGASHPHRQPEPPLLKPASPGTTAIVLPPPRLEHWMHHDPPLARVIEERRSAGTAGTTALTLAQLGDFLHRTAHPHSDQHRALPSAGARHELEFYAGVHHVDALPRAFYHYHAPSHRLHALTAPDDAVGELLARAGAAWSTGEQIPHVVIVVAARFARMASRYASIAYRNTLLDAGIAIEAMYLNATAMRLAPCALGINLPELFARMTGLDPFEETPVAMFALSAPSG